MMKRILIVNADDCNLTPGVTEAILRCHDRGIVSSTTWLVNLPFEDRDIRRLLSRKRLGVGLHLNITLGRPVSSAREVKSLIEPDGVFKRFQRQIATPPDVNEIEAEYRCQIRLFERIFSRLPTHVDTHHQMHDHPVFFRAFLRAANRYSLAVRRSKLMLANQGILKRESEGRKTTDFFFGNFSPEGYWRRECLETLIKNLAEGVSEIMCHPGRNDHALSQISSFTEGRQKEYSLFVSAYLRRFLKDSSVEMAHFGLCYSRQRRLEGA